MHMNRLSDTRREGYIADPALRTAEMTSVGTYHGHFCLVQSHIGDIALPAGTWELTKEILGV